MPQVSSITSSAQTGGDKCEVTLSTPSNQLLLHSPWAGEARTRFGKLDCKAVPAVNTAWSFQSTSIYSDIIFFLKAQAAQSEIVQSHSQRIVWLEGNFTTGVSKSVSENQPRCKHLNI